MNKNERNSLWRKANPDKCRGYSKTHREKYPEETKVSRKRWRDEHPESVKVSQTLTNAKRRAKKANVPFNLTRATLPSIPERCPILGIRLVVGEGNFSDSSASLDRIIPELGYVEGNVHWISYRANSIKRDATTEELVLVAEYFSRLTKTEVRANR